MLLVGGSRDRYPVVSLRIFSEATDGTICPGVDSASKNEYQEIPGGKDGRPRKGNDLTTFVVPKVEKMRSPNLPDPKGPAQACSGKTLPI